MIGIKLVLWPLRGAHGHLQTHQPHILRFNFAYKIHAYIIYNILYYTLERVFVRTSSPRPSPAGRYINIIYLNLNRFLQIFSPDFFGLNFYGKILTIYYKLGKNSILKFQKKFVKSNDFTKFALAENFQYFNIENFLNKKKNPTRFPAGGVLF